MLAGLVGLVCGLVLLAAAPARADDEVILRDGTSIRGDVLEERPDVVRVAVLRGDDRVVIELPRAQVHWVRRLAQEAERLERDAQAALAAGDAHGAVATLRQLTRARPDDPRARRELGFALILQGAYAEAATTLERACELDPIDFEAHLQLAQALEALGRRDDALARFRQAARLGPRHVVAWRGLARLLLARAGPRDREEALDALDRATREAPDDEGLLLARVEAILTAPGAAPRARARALLEAHVARRPAATMATRRLARLLGQAGEHAPARDRLAAVAAREDVAADVRERASVEAALFGWLAAGAPGLAPDGLDVGDDAADPDAAARGLDLLLEALDEEPPLADAALAPRLLLARARADVRRGRLAEATPWLDRAALEASLAPGGHDVLAHVLVLQEVLVTLGREPGARTFFNAQAASGKARQAAALLPWLSAAHETLARALEREGEFEAAARAWTRAAGRAAAPDERRRLEAAAAAARDAHARRDRTRGL